MASNNILQVDAQHFFEEDDNEQRSDLDSSNEDGQAEQILPPGQSNAQAMQKAHSMKVPKGEGLTQGVQIGYQEQVQQQYQMPDPEYPGSQGPWFNMQQPVPAQGFSNPYAPYYPHHANTYQHSMHPQQLLNYPQTSSNSAQANTFMMLKNQQQQMQQPFGVFTMQPHIQQQLQPTNLYQPVGGVASEGMRHQMVQVKSSIANRKNSRPGSASVFQKKNQIINSSKGNLSLTSGGGVVQSISGQNRSQIPRNFSAYEKEQLYEETLALRIDKNNAAKETTILKTQVKTLEKEVKRKDQVIKQLLQEQSQPSPTEQPYAFTGNSSSLQHQQSTTFAGEVQHTMAFKSKIKQLKAEVLTKQEELLALQRNIKFTRLKELEAEVEQFKEEALKMKALYFEEQAKPKIDPQQYQMLANEYQAQTQVVASLQEQIDQLQQVVGEKELMVTRRDKKLQRLTERVRFYKERLKNSQKKIKVLHAKLFEIEKLSVGLISGKAQANQSSSSQNQQQVKQQRYRPQWNLSQGYPSRKGSPGRQVVAENPTAADWFEKYIIEKTKNERMLRRLEKLGTQVDLNELYQDDGGDDEAEERQGLASEGSIMNIIVNIRQTEDDAEEERHIKVKMASTMEDLRDQLRHQLALESEQDFVIKLSNGKQMSSIDQLLPKKTKKKKGKQGVSQDPPKITVEMRARDQDHAEATGQALQQDDYEEEQFEQEDEEEEQNMLDLVQWEDVAETFKEIKLKLQIKKVPSKKSFKYLLAGVGADMKSLSIAQLKAQFMRRFAMGEEEALFAARYLIEEPPEGGKGTQVAYKEEREGKRSQIKAKFRQALGQQYSIYNGFAMTGLLGRLTTILDEKKGEIQDALRDADSEGDGEVPLQAFYEIFKELDVPEFDEDIKEFFEFLVFRQSDSLSKINYYAFLEIFDEDYLIDKSPYEDKEPFEGESESTVVMDDEERNAAAASGVGGNEEEIEVDEEELMMIVDEVLGKITGALKSLENSPDSESKLISFLFKSIKGCLNAQTIETSEGQIMPGQKANSGSLQQVVYYMHPNDFVVKYLRETLQVALSEKELQCLLHVMIREDLQEVILYDEFKAIIKNYLKKEKVIAKSISQGIRYDLVRSQETLGFLAQVKALLGTTATGNSKVIGSALDMFTNARGVVKEQYVVNKSKQQAQVHVLDFETMLDHLFMKYQIRCPPAKAQQELKTLFSIDDKYPDIVLVKKIDRILADYDYIQVNLIKMVNLPANTYADRYTALAPVKAHASSSTTAIGSGNGLPQEKKKKGVQFSQQPSEVVEAKPAAASKEKPKKEEDDFQYDELRKKYTKKAYEIPEDDDDGGNESIEEVAEKRHVHNQQQQLKQNSRQDASSDVDLTHEEQKAAAAAKPKVPSMIPDQKKTPQQPQPQMYQHLQQKQMPAKTQTKEEKMDFHYDEFRKKYTVKAEEVEEEDFIEDNYD